MVFNYIYNRVNNNCKKMKSKRSDEHKVMKLDEQIGNYLEDHNSDSAPQSGNSVHRAAKVEAKGKLPEQCDSQNANKKNNQEGTVSTKASGETESKLSEPCDSQNALSRRQKKNRKKALSTTQQEGLKKPDEEAQESNNITDSQNAKKNKKEENKKNSTVSTKQPAPDSQNAKKSKKEKNKEKSTVSTKASGETEFFESKLPEPCDSQNALSKTQKRNQKRKENRKKALATTQQEELDTSENNSVQQVLQYSKQDQIVTLPENEILAGRKQNTVSPNLELEKKEEVLEKPGPNCSEPEKFSIETRVKLPEPCNLQNDKKREEYDDEHKKDSPRAKSELDYFVYNLLVLFILFVGIIYVSNI